MSAYTGMISIINTGSSEIVGFELTHRLSNGGEQQMMDAVSIAVGQSVLDKDTNLYYFRFESADGDSDIWNATFKRGLRPYYINGKTFNYRHMEEGSVLVLALGDDTYSMLAPKTESSLLNPYNDPATTVDAQDEMDLE